MTINYVPLPTGKGETMYYIGQNAHIPTGVVSSTARLGRKWYDDLVIGEVFRCVNKDSGDLITRAVCIRKELTTYANALRTAFDNHVAFDRGNTLAPNVVCTERLRKALEAAYPDLQHNTMITKIHMLPLLDWAEDAVRQVYYAARWTPDRPVESEQQLWTTVRDVFGFKPGESTELLGK